MGPIPQERLILANPSQSGNHPCVEFTNVSRSEVAQPPPLQPAPQAKILGEAELLAGVPENN